MNSLLFICLFLSSFAAALSTEEWKSQSIYQLLTDRFARSDLSTTAPCDVAAQPYCGGTWEGVIEKLDYIQGMGFTAIWISPIPIQIPDNGSFHGYWQKDLYVLNPHFGDEISLKTLSDALHHRGMYLMVDVVANHFGRPPSVNGSVDFSELYPFNSSVYFHPECDITSADYLAHDAAVQLCWIAGLPDVNTTEPYVREVYYDWIAGLVDTYNIDGFRVDTVKHVEPSFWPGFVEAAGVYMVGEVLDEDVPYVCSFQDIMPGLLNYGLWFNLTAAFKDASGSMYDLVTAVNAVKDDCQDSTALGTFFENHDQPRFPSLNEDIAPDKNGIAFAMLADGIPIIYQGEEQHYDGGGDPYNREALWLSGYSTTSELYGFITTLNKIRSFAISVASDYLSYKAYPIYYDDHTIAMRKGFNGTQIVSVYTNVGSDGESYSVSLSGTGYDDGAFLTDILSCDKYESSNGTLDVTLSGGEPIIFYPADLLSGSGLCGY